MEADCFLVLSLGGKTDVAYVSEDFLKMVKKEASAVLLEHTWGLLGSS